MEDKTQYEALVEELQKTAENFRVAVAEIGERFAKLLPYEEDTWEMKYPYKEGEKYWALYDDGTVNLEAWLEYGNECNTFNQGNAFQTEQAAKLEAKRRNLLTRFRAFRDECNNGWKPDWSNENSCKYCLLLEGNEFGAVRFYLDNMFNQFGYFKNKNDALKAIELFGDEIKELFVEGE